MYVRRGLGELACMLGKVEGWLTYLERMKKKTDWKGQCYFEELL